VKTKRHIVAAISALVLLGLVLGAQGRQIVER
jgi:hypothetical protein